MKNKSFLMVIAIALLIIPSYLHASTVFDTTGWIIGKQGFSYDFNADIEPFEYKATITDLSISPTFGLTDIFLSISTATEVIDSRFGEGSIIFPVVEGNTYFANVFANGAGLLESGNYGLLIETMPIPTTLILLGSGLIYLLGLRRKSMEN
jgi:hypothetical protein